MIRESVPQEHAAIQVYREIASFIKQGLVDLKREIDCSVIVAGKSKAPLSAMDR